MDVKSPYERSKNMAAIKSRNTKPEMKLRRELHRLGLRYRIEHGLPGKPDIVFPCKRIVIFVDGCFWHGCPDCYREPQTNREFWARKIRKNKERDNEVDEILSDQGWKILRFWEHEINRDLNTVVGVILNELNREDLLKRNE